MMEKEKKKEDVIIICCSPWFEFGRCPREKSKGCAGCKFASESILSNP